jgi:hypothetical protein
MAARSIVVLLALALAAPAAAQLRDRKLDERIPKTDRARFEALWAKEWNNPRVYVDTAAVYLLLDGKPAGNAMRPVLDLRGALVKLPVRQWPYGRIVALSPSARLRTDPSGPARLEEVREVLRSLDVEIIETPVGCDCE